MASVLGDPVPSGSLPNLGDSSRDAPSTCGRGEKSDPDVGEAEEAEGKAAEVSREKQEDEEPQPKKSFAQAG